MANFVPAIIAPGIFFKYEWLLIIADPAYWVRNENDILEWLNRCTPDHHYKGMIIEFKNDEDRCAFLLCWG